MSTNEIYDVVIIGGGPGGLSAALYASRGRLKTLVVEEKTQMGGQCATTSELENYPGVMDTGPGLSNKFYEHAKKFGTEFKKDRVTGIKVDADGLHKRITLKSGEELVSKSVIIATGTKPRILGIPGEEEFKGRGVSYCATCDADFYEELDVVVVGSGNTAVEESCFLTKVVNKVNLVVIHDEGHLDADRIAQEQAFANPKINFIWNSTVDAIEGDELVNSVRLKNVKTGELTNLETPGVFMFVGTVPQTDWLKGSIPLASSGYIEVDGKQESSVAGVFAVGDVTDKFLRQVVTAAGDGAVAAVAAIQYIEQEEYWHEHVLGADKPVLAVFWSPLQADSVALMPKIEKFAAENGCKVVPVDSYKNRRLADRYQAKVLPTVVRLDKGNETYRLENPTENDFNALLK